MRTSLILTAGLAALTLAACSGRDETAADEATAAGDRATDTATMAPDAPAPATPDATTPADPDNPTGPTSPPRQPPPFLPPEPTSATNPSMTSPGSPPPK